MLASVARLRKFSWTIYFRSGLTLPISFRGHQSVIDLVSPRGISYFSEFLFIPFHYFVPFLFDCVISESQSLSSEIYFLTVYFSINTCDCIMKFSQSVFQLYQDNYILFILAMFSVNSCIVFKLLLASLHWVSMYSCSSMNFNRIHILNLISVISAISFSAWFKTLTGDVLWLFGGKRVL